MTGGLPEDDDGALAARARAGDEQAFGALMRRHKERVYRFVRAYVADAEEAYDLTQETFAAAWNGLSRYDPNRPLAAWLKRIALNKCRDWSRRRAVRRFFFAAESIDALAEAPTAADASEERLEVNLRRLDLAIAALPLGLKEPLLLTAIDGMSHQDAAKVLNLTAKAIESRVYRAKAALARALAND